MKIIIKVLSGLAIWGILSPAQAGIMVEPFLGYSMGNWKTPSVKDDISGTELGARVGGTFTLFSLGAEFSMGNFTIDSNPEVDIDTTDMGIFFGVDLPVLIRAYGTYFISSEGETSANEYEGSGFRLGVGYTGLPFVSINLEHIARTYDERNGSSIEDREITVNQLSISLPLP